MGMGGGGLPRTDPVAEARRQEEMQIRQMQILNQQQIEAENRMKQRVDYDRQAALFHAEAGAKKKEARRVQEESQEAALYNELTGQSKVSSKSTFNMGLNMDAPVIKRPEYESETRPQ